MEVRHLRKYFPIFGGVTKKQIGEVKAVDDVSFSIHRGETFGLVGETGCGKTTLGRCILRLIEPTSGNVNCSLPQKVVRIQEYGVSPVKTTPVKQMSRFDLTKLSNRDLKRHRRHLQIVYQDPFSSLDPRMLVKDIVGEPLKIFKVAKGVDLLDQVTELLEKVGLNREHLYRFPHEFSGGQRQRICIARAIALNPSFLVLDEPTSALDVSVQAQILKLLQELQRELELTFLLITHDLSIIDYMADRVAVMYLGKIVEIAEKDKIFEEPLHPYTRALLSAVPIPDPEGRDSKKVIFLEGDIPSPINPPSGCRFHTRCPEVGTQCPSSTGGGPDLLEVSPGHFVACYRYQED